MSKRLIKAIAAMTKDRVIGNAGGLPKDWNYPEEIKRFKDLTLDYPVLMGRKTYLSLPESNRPLPGRINIVASKSDDPVDSGADIIQIKDPVEFIENFIQGNSNLDSDILWIIGGAEIYKSTMHLWDELHLSLIKNSHEGDVFFPEFEDSFEEDISNRSEEADYTYYLYKKSR